jgi:hypothetical protein
MCAANAPTIALDLHTLRLNKCIYPELIELPDLLTSLFEWNPPPVTVAATAHIHQ